MAADCGRRNIPRQIREFIGRKMISRLKLAELRHYPYRPNAFPLLITCQLITYWRTGVLRVDLGRKRSGDTVEVTELYFALVSLAPPKKLVWIR